MNTLPPAFVERIKKQLGAEAAAFFQALETPAPVSIRRNPGKVGACNELEITEGKTTPVPWCPDAVYLEGRPVFTLDPLFHGGAYYVQEASSMFLHHVLKQLLPPTPVRMLDLCAAPGGKSTLAASLLPPGSLLVSNEVIRSRAAILKENLIKWGQDNTVVTQSDPAAFRALEGAFDFLLVDAPCSGEGMFRKDPASIREWSESNLRLCSERQQRILADSWACLRPGGVLIYSTCTYNPAENERIIEWLIAGGEAESIPLSCPFPGIMPADSAACAFRFYPHKTAGEGFFLAALRKTAGKDYTPRKNKKAKNTPRTALSKELRAYIRQPEQYAVFPDNGILRLVPESQAAFIETLSASTNVLYAGCEAAETNGRKLRLLPPLALWQGLDAPHDGIYDADRPTALAFLKKEDIPPIPSSADWLLVSYRGTGLGWCKNLGNRLNNYYPKEWRIRMQIE